MSNLKLSKELKQLVFKRKLGGGEFSYVSIATGEERQGKGEMVDLLTQEERWKRVLSCQGNEAEASFMKKVKKQITFVLFEDQVIQNPSHENGATPCKDPQDNSSQPDHTSSNFGKKNGNIISTEEDTVKQTSFTNDAGKSNGKSIFSENELQTSSDADESDGNSVSVGNVPKSLNNSAAGNCDISQDVEPPHKEIVPNGVELEPPKKKRKVRMGPASKVKRKRSVSPEQGGQKSAVASESLEDIPNDDLDVTFPLERFVQANGKLEDINGPVADEMKYSNDDLDATIPLENSKLVKSNELDELKTKNVSEANAQTKGSDMNDEIIVDNLPDIEEIEDQEIGYSNIDVFRKVLVFNVDLSIEHDDCEDFFFSKFPNVENAQRTMIKRNSYTNGLKYTGVYVVTFETEVAALEFIDTEVNLSSNSVLYKIMLKTYEQEKFFQQKVRRCSVIEKNFQMVMSQLEDLKSTGKLDHCVSVQIWSSNVSDDDVQEYFCGVKSEFIDNFGKPIEESRRIVDQDQKPFVEYVLVFEVQEDAKLFVKDSGLHNFKNLKMNVLLLIDSMQRIGFSQKAKNFVDDEHFTDVDDSRRVAIQTVNRLKSADAIQTYFKQQFLNLTNIHRCEVNDHFLGIYILTFKNEGDAKKAVATDIDSSEFVTLPMLILLRDYIKLRTKYLKQKFCQDQVNGQKNVEYWGNIETEYKSHYANNEEENLQLNKQEMLTVKGKSTDFDIKSFDMFIGCEGFGDVSEELKQDIEQYFSENHENVKDVFFSDFVYVRFHDGESADRFFTLNYIRYKGRQIVPFWPRKYYDTLDEAAKNRLVNILLRQAEDSYEDNGE